MCIAIYSPHGIQISKEHFYNSYKANPDGMGLMFAHRGKIEIHKELKDIDTFYRVYTQLSQAFNVVVHFRIGTSGGNDLLNCHPFKVHSDLAMCHNGILSIDVPKESKINDTQIYIKKILSKLPKNFYKDEWFVDLLERAIGSNKFLFLDSAGKVSIINERLGHWKDGIWYSNYSYESYGYTLTTGTVPARGVSSGYTYDEHGWSKRWGRERVCDYCGETLTGQHEIREGICAACFEQNFGFKIENSGDDEAWEEYYTSYESEGKTEEKKLINKL